MPQVPTYDNFKVLPSAPNNATVDLGVSVEQLTMGSRQLERVGEQITRAGGDFAAIQTDALAQANQLRVDDSLNKLKEATLDLRFNPKTGFENVRGVDALQRPSGQSLTQDYLDQLNKNATSIEDGLANDAQKAAFRRNANNLITSFHGEVEQHEGAQFQSYALSVRDGTIRNRMNEIGLNYNKPEVVDQAIQSIQAATFDQGRLLGKSAEWSQAQALEATSKAHRIAIETAMEKNDVTYADQYMKRYAKDMGAEDILAVNGTLTKQLDGQLGLTTAQQVITEVGPRISTSDTDRAFNIAMGTESNHRQFDAKGQPLTSSAGAIGIAQVMPETAKEIAKANNIEWDENKYKTDANYNSNLGKLYFKQQLKDFNGSLAQAYAAYNAGPGKDSATGLDAKGKPLPGVRPALARAKAKGTPDAWLQELPAETQNYVSKNMTAFGNGQGQYAKPTLYELQQEVRNRIGNSSPERLKIGLQEVERQYNDINTSIKQKNEETVATAMRTIMDNGGRFTDLPANLRGAIPPEEVPKLMDFAKKISSGDDTTNLWLYNQLTDPAKLKSMSDNEFFAMRKELSEADFKHFSEERSKLITGRMSNGPGDMNTDAITRTLNDRLNSMGIDPTPKDASDEAMQVGAVRKFVNESIAVEQANRGKKMTDVEVSSFIDTILSQKSKVFTDTGWFGTSMKITGTSNIPDATKEALVKAFKAKGIDNPTDADLLNAYWRQVSMNMKPKAKKNG